MLVHPPFEKAVLVKINIYNYIKISVSVSIYRWFRWNRSFRVEVLYWLRMDVQSLLKPSHHRLWDEAAHSGSLKDKVSFEDDNFVTNLEQKEILQYNCWVWFIVLLVVSQHKWLRQFARLRTYRTYILCINHGKRACRHGRDSLFEYFHCCTNSCSRAQFSLLKISGSLQPFACKCWWVLVLITLGNLAKATKQRNAGTVHLLSVRRTGVCLSWFWHCIKNQHSYLRVYSLERCVLGSFVLYNTYEENWTLILYSHYICETRRYVTFWRLTFWRRCFGAAVLSPWYFCRILKRMRFSL